MELSKTSAAYLGICSDAKPESEVTCLYSNVDGKHGGVPSDEPWLHVCNVPGQQRGYHLVSERYLSAV